MNMILLYAHGLEKWAMSLPTFRTDAAFNEKLHELRQKAKRFLQYMRIIDHNPFYEFGESIDNIMDCIIKEKKQNGFRRAITMIDVMRIVAEDDKEEIKNLSKLLSDYADGK